MSCVPGKLFVISAPSGAGKTTLVNAVLEKLGSQHALERAITCTSRRPRGNEIHGHDYYFLDHADFADKIEAGFFLEWSTAYGTYYGSPVALLEQLHAGTSLIVILDIKGAVTLQGLYKDTVLIWIHPPQLSDLRARLQGRSTESAEEIGFRLKLAEDEMIHSSIGSAFHYTFINDDFKQSLEVLSAIIIKELL